MYAASDEQLKPTKQMDFSSCRLLLDYIDQLYIKVQVPASQRMVGVEIYLLFSELHHLHDSRAAVVLRYLQLHALVGVDIRRHLAPVHLEYELVEIRPLGITSPDVESLGIAGVHADDGLFKSRYEHALAYDELKGFPALRRIEPAPVVQGACIMDLYDIAMFCVFHFIQIGRAHVW